MVISSNEVDRFLALIRDIQTRVLPDYLADSALLVFFIENPHLLMTRKFDEHMQMPLTPFQAQLLRRSPEDDPDTYDILKCRYVDLPDLEFRTASGRWASLVKVPLWLGDFAADTNFRFSFNARRVLKQAESDLQALDLTDKEEGAYHRFERYDKKLDQLMALLDSDTVSLSLEALVGDLRERVQRPRESSSVLWSPKLWTPREQAFQRALLDTTLAPHLEAWRTSGICFEDLNPSEFEDLVGEVLFAAGLKIYKVREAPQGGRDLIARGTLMPNEEPIEMAVEVKHREVIDRPEVQLALYQNRAYPALLFVTSGRFTAGVFKEKTREENRFRLFLKDGLAIGDLIRIHFRLDAETRPHRGLRRGIRR